MLNYQLLFKQMKLKDVIHHVYETQKHSLGIIHITEETKEKMKDEVMRALAEVCAHYEHTGIYKDNLNTDQLETVVAEYETKYVTGTFIGCVYASHSWGPKISLFCPSDGTSMSMKAKLFSEYWRLIKIILTDQFHIDKNRTRSFFEKIYKRITLTDDLLDTIIFIPIDDVLKDLFK